MSDNKNAAADIGNKAAGGKGKIILPWVLFAATAIGFGTYAIIDANQSNVSKGNVGEEAVATVDGDKITANEVYQLMLKTVGTQAVDQLIFEKLLDQEAAKNNIAVSQADIDAEYDKIKASFPDEDTFNLQLMYAGLTEQALKDQMKPQLLLTKLIEPSIEVTDEELQTYYNENIGQFETTPTKVQASHILVDTQEEAEQLLEEIKGGADFAKLAEEHSKDPGSAAQGGDLGFFGRGEMVPAFEESAFSLEVGGLSGVVASDYGYHIIKVTDKQEGVVAPFEEKKEVVREAVVAQKVQERSTTYIEELRTAAKIENSLKADS